MMKKQAKPLKKVDKQPLPSTVTPIPTKGEPEAEPTILSTVLDLVNCLIIVLNQNLRIVRVNQACEKLTGYSFDEVKGKYLWDLFLLPDEIEPVRTGIEGVSKGQAPRMRENNWRTKDGRQRIITWSATALFDANGVANDIIIAGTDMTESKQAALLMDARESLQRVSTALLQHSTTLEYMLELICTEAQELTGATGSVILLKEDEKWLRVMMSSGTPKPLLDRLPIGESLAGLVINRGKPMLLNDWESQVQAYYHSPDLNTLLAVPLRVNGVPFGVMDVVNKPAGFTQDDIEIMALFADQAAIAIENARLYERAEQLAIVEERQRLARELHDSVTQALYSVNLFADAAQLALTAGKDQDANEHLQELRTMAREAMLDMRLLIFELRPPVLEKEGLVAAIQARLEAVEVRSGIRAEFLVEGEVGRLPHIVEEEVYRIAQETLTNVVKHAGAQRVSIHLQFSPDRLHLEVCDDGRGFDLAKAKQSGGLGLQSMEERIQRIGGRLKVDSVPGQGTKLLVDVDI